jgi:hypothetical protein
MRPFAYFCTGMDYQHSWYFLITRALMACTSALNAVLYCPNLPLEPLPHAHAPLLHLSWIHPFTRSVLYSYHTGKKKYFHSILSANLTGSVVEHTSCYYYCQSPSGRHIPYSFSKTCLHALTLCHTQSTSSCLHVNAPGDLQCSFRSYLLIPCYCYVGLLNIYCTSN